MTIVEFLTARLEDLEADAGETHNLDCDKVRNGLRDPEFGWECDCGEPSRVLADVAAKRRIIAACDYDGMTAEYVLQCLAQPYVDHPDFDPAWSVA